MTAGVNVRRFLSIVALAACAAVSGRAHAQQPSLAKSQPTPYKDPALATVIGVLVPGGGQLYAERYGKGLGLLAGTAAAVGIAVDANHASKCNFGQSCSVSGIQTTAIIVAVVVWGYGWATAGRDARLRNTQMLNHGTSFAPFLDQHEGRVMAGLALTTR